MKYAVGTTAKLTNVNGYLNGLRVKVRAVSKTTQSRTVELLEQPAADGPAYKKGDTLNVMPYELKEDA